MTCLTLFFLNEIQDSRDAIVVLGTAVGKDIDEGVWLGCLECHLNTRDGHFRTVSTALCVDTFQILVERLG